MADDEFSGPLQELAEAVAEEVDAASRASVLEQELEEMGCDPALIAEATAGRP